MASSKTTKWGYIDTRGRVVIDFGFDHAGQFREGLAVVTINGKKGFIDRTGRLRIEAQFGPEAQNFCEGLALAQVASGKCGYIDRVGAFVIEPVYDWAGCFSEGMSFIRVADRYGFITRDGTVVVEPQFELAGDFSHGFAPVYDGDEWHYIDIQGKRTFGPFGEVNEFGDGVACIWVDDGDALLDTGGKITAVSGVDWMSDYCEDGLVEVHVGDRYGYVNKDGQVVIDPRYEKASTFSEGRAAVQIKGKWGYINSSGEVVIEPRFDEARFFREGLAFVKVAGQSAYIDWSGKVVFETDLGAYFPFSEGLTPVHS